MSRESVLMTKPRRYINNYIPLKEIVMGGRIMMLEQERGRSLTNTESRRWGVGGHDMGLGLI